MQNSISQKGLKVLIEILKIKPIDLVRKKESYYKENLEGKKITSAQWLKILSEHPELIERPIVIKGNKAMIGRDAEQLIEFLNE